MRLRTRATIASLFSLALFGALRARAQQPDSSRDASTSCHSVVLSVAGVFELVGEILLFLNAVGSVPAAEHYRAEATRLREQLAGIEDQVKSASVPTP